MSDIGRIAVALTALLLLILTTAALQHRSPTCHGHGSLRNVVWSTTAAPPLCRRQALLQSSIAVIATSVLLDSAISPKAHASSICISGVGDACMDLSGGNAYIQALQEKSAANKERYEKEARDSYYMKNYPDYFGSVGKTMIKKSDGTFVLLNEAEMEQLKKEGRLALEYPKTLNGQFKDLTQRPILVLKN